MNFSSTNQHSKKSNSAFSLLTRLSSHRRVELIDRIEDTRRIIRDDDSSSSLFAAATAGLLHRDENILLSRGSSRTTAPFNLSVTQLEEPSDSQNYIFYGRSIQEEETPTS